VIAGAAGGRQAWARIRKSAPCVVRPSWTGHRSWHGPQGTAEGARAIGFFNIADAPRRFIATGENTGIVAAETEWGNSSRPLVKCFGWHSLQVSGISAAHHFFFFFRADRSAPAHQLNGREKRASAGDARQLGSAAHGAVSYADFICFRRRHLAAGPPR